MKQDLEKNFGLIIAFVIPGFISVLGLSYHSPILHGWLSIEKSGTFADLSFALIACICIGLIISAFRCRMFDKIFFKKEFESAPENFSKLDEKSQNMVGVLIEGHYRYYQFYSNTAVALSAYMLFRLIRDVENHLLCSIRSLFIYCSLLVVFYVLYSGAKDCIEKYFRRLNNLLKGEIK